MGGWSVLALNYAGPHEPALRIALAGAAAIATLLSLLALAMPRWRWRALIGFSLLFAALLTWYAGLTPTNLSLTVPVKLKETDSHAYFFAK